MASNDIRAPDGSGIKLRLQAEPVLRFTNPVGGSKDGALFLWLGEGDRPVVASGILWNPRRIWAQEFSSLSTTRLVANSADGGGSWRCSHIALQPRRRAPSPQAQGRPIVLFRRPKLRRCARRDVLMAGSTPPAHRAR